MDQDALIEALRSGRIAAAGLDVMTPEPLPTDNELIKLKNCGIQFYLNEFFIFHFSIIFISVLTPHIASATVQARTAMADLCVQNILNALDGKSMPAQLC